ncbi:hypothetical protein Q8A67_024106 [Cirrhinus molitorella]|uniref:Uncharacterized protein n=1 Tax=Cirrhinus molitorella TaxID=172907 RepID=A0AA88P4B3_9TELE|nr:hypothetical protein Q8A67_024106 [Cirrhinus molitorella]
MPRERRARGFVFGGEKCRADGACKGWRRMREVGAGDEADTRRRSRELRCTPLSEATAWKLLLNPKVHAYFTVMFKSQEPNL